MVSARSNLVGRLGAFSGTSAGDFSVGFRTAVAVELPGISDLLNFVEIELGDEQFILVAAGLLDDFAARIAEVALAVEFADFPGSFGADAIDGSDEVSVGDGVGGLLEFPKIFGEAGDGGGGVVDNFRSIKAEDARAFGEMAVVTYIYADAGVTSLENGVARVSWREIKFFPEARMAMGNVVLAVLAEVAAIGVNDRGSVEVDAGHLDFVDRHDQHHLVFLGELLHCRDGRTGGNLLGELIPAGLLLGAKVRAIKNFLEAGGLPFLFGRVGDQVFVFGDHFFFDFGERKLFRRPFPLGLNQAPADETGHTPPPELTQAKKKKK